MYFLASGPQFTSLEFPGRLPVRDGDDPILELGEMLADKNTFVSILPGAETLRMQGVGAAATGPVHRHRVFSPRDTPA
jgi:hypothetical protein